MANPTGSNEKISSKVEIDYPDFTKLPDHVREKRLKSYPPRSTFSGCWVTARAHSIQ